MPAVSGSIPNLIGGVSQQPPEIRSLNCSTALINTWSDVGTGLGTRPFARYLGLLGPKPAANKTIATHTIQKSTGRYELVVSEGAVRVMNLDTGTTETVVVEGSASAYLDVDDAATNIGFVTVADTTFIYNRTKTVTATTTAEGSGLNGIVEEGITRKNPNRHATLWVKQRGTGDMNYTVYYNGVQIANHFDTDNDTATDIYDSLSSEITTAGYTITKIASAIGSLVLTSEGDFLTSLDDWGDQSLETFNDSVTEFVDLPKVDRTGRLVMVHHDIEEDADDYWVWFMGNVWQETFGWNAWEKPDNDTMPVILVDNKDGTWTLKYTDWPGRTVGDADSNPSPTFIGRTIRNMFVHKGRMCILSDENFIASEVSRFENFYRTTCTQLLDDDPIDVASPEGNGEALNYAMEFNRGLLLFSSSDQFRIEGDSEGLLSPNTVTINHVNAYNASSSVDPVYIGPNVLFVDDFGTRGFAAVREYQVEQVFGREVALPVTDQCPEYIPSGVYKMVGSSSSNVIVALTSGDRSSIWVYNYYFNSEGKVQSAWQTWELPGPVHSAEFSHDLLVLLVEYDDNLHVLSTSFESGVDTVMDEDSVQLDFRLHSRDLTVTLDGQDTLVTLPFTVAPSDLEKIVAVISPENTGSDYPCRIYNPVSQSGDTLRFTRADLTAQDFLIGFRYRFYWTPSPIYMRDRNLVAIQDGRLQLRRLSLLYNNSGPFTTHFHPTGQRQTYTSTFSGFILGSGSSLIGELSLKSGEFRVGVNGASEALDLEVEAWTPWRVRFSSIEWDGRWRPRKRRTS